MLKGVCTPFARHKGAFRDVRPDALLAHVLQGLVERPGLDPEKVETW